MAADPDPLLDYCVGSPYSPCQDPATVTNANFLFQGLAETGNPKKDPLGVSVSFGTVGQWPALHTMGLAMARIIYDEGGLINLHTHRARRR